MTEHMHVRMTATVYVRYRRNALFRVHATWYGTCIIVCSCAWVLMHPGGLHKLSRDVKRFVVRAYYVY